MNHTVRRTTLIITCFFCIYLLAGVFGCESDGTESEWYPTLREAEPLPRTSAEELGAAAFSGESAEDNPLPPLSIPEHPILDNNGNSRIHNDANNSGVYNRPGLRGRDIEVVTSKVGSILTGICATLTFDPTGHIVGSCLDGASVWLMMFNPDNLDIVAELNLGPRPPVENSSGGAYFSLDNQGRIIIGPGSNKVERYRIDMVDGAPQFVLDRSKDVSAHIPKDSMLQDTVPDWQGRVWFTVTSGEMGYVDYDTDTVELIDLGEELQNAMAVDEEAVYTLTYQALYRVSVDEEGKINVDWRAPYDPGEGAQGVLPGSGSTPTLLGTQNDLIAICDNADSQINLLVYDRVTGGEPICKVPLFKPGKSATENSVVGYNDDIVVVNNAGFAGVFESAAGVHPGMERYHVRADRKGCDLVWENDAAILNSAQLSTTTGLIYGYGADPNFTDPDVFYLLAHDWRSGAEVFRVYAGDDMAFNPVLGQPHLHPDGRTVMGVFKGVALFKDTR